MSEVRTFNSPLEAGFRSLFVLAASEDGGLDTQRLLYLDYAVVHSGDIGGPPSLHPQTPVQRDELLVRRNLIQRGVALMRSRELMQRDFTQDGISYRATDAGRHVAKQFDTEYAARLRVRAAWALEAFDGYTDDELLRVLRHE